MLYGNWTDGEVVNNLDGAAQRADHPVPVGPQPADRGDHQGAQNPPELLHTTHTHTSSAAAGQGRRQDQSGSRQLTRAAAT